MPPLVAVVPRVILSAPFRGTSIERILTSRAGNDLAIRILGIMRAFLALKFRTFSPCDAHYAVFLAQHDLATICGVKCLKVNQSLKLTLDRLILCPLFSNDASIDRICNIESESFKG